MRVFLIALLMISSTIFLNGQKTDTDSSWSKDGFFSIVFNQIQQVNWVKGGESTISGAALLKYQINYKQPKYSWNNNFDFAYGLLKIEDASPRKNEDVIDISSKFGHVAYDNFYYSLLVNFKSQFANGYNYPNDSLIISKFFSPAYLIFSLGLDYKFDENFTLFLSPLTGKHTYVLDETIADMGIFTGEAAKYDANKVKIKSGASLKADFGAYFKASLKKDIWENVTLASALSLFNNYTDKNAGNRANIDIDWNSSIVMKINKYLSANIFLHLIYDHDVLVPLYENLNGVKTKVGAGPRLQVKEVFGLGFSFKI
jgi:hypothetical protein